MRVIIDAQKCQGHSRCYALAPDVFDVDDYGQSTTRNGGAVPADREDVVRLAVLNCPEFAITIVDE